MSNLEALKKDINKRANKKRVALLQRFFKTGKGGYGEGDIFLGLTVPDQRVIARRYNDLSITSIRKLLRSPFHEHRLTALIILSGQYKKADQAGKKKIFDIYLAERKYINNWDLVDTTAPHIIGAYLVDKSREKLYQLARSSNVWDKRIAILSTFAFIKEDDFGDTLAISQMLLKDKHDLIHKAVGWMLREIGKRDQRVEKAFLDKHAAIMPRTMLRYAIEKFPQQDRKKYLART